MANIDMISALYELNMADGMIDETFNDLLLMKMAYENAPSTLNYNEYIDSVAHMKFCIVRLTEAHKAVMLLLVDAAVAANNGPVINPGR